jgi:hypothetical protein
MREAHRPAESKDPYPSQKADEIPFDEGANSHDL